jgi:hypothetical protein
MLRTTTVALLAALALTGTGCVTFEKETMVFVFSADGKEVRALFLYEGIRVQGDRDLDLKQAKEQLASFLGEKQFCLGSNSFLHIDLEDEKDDNARAKALKEKFRGHLGIHNGGFFLDKQGRLCGWQTITVKDHGKLADDLNVLITARMAEVAEEELTTPKARAGLFDEVSFKLIQKACKNKHIWLRVEPGRLNLTVPMSGQSASRIKEGLFELDHVEKLQAALAKPFQPKEGDTDSETRRKQWLSQQHWLAGRIHDRLAFLRDNPVSFDQRAGRVTVSLGLGDG